MSPSRRGFNETRGSIQNSDISLEISKLVKKPLKEESDSDQRDDGITERNEVLEVVSKSWRDKNRLYPPFRQRSKNVVAKKDDRGQDAVENSIPTPSKFRSSVCMRKRQFPIVSTNISLARNESLLNFGRSDFLYSSSGCRGDNEIPSLCGLQDAPCIGPICGQDTEPCDITRGSDRADDVCQDAVSAQGDKSDDVSVPGDKPESHHYMTVCGESIDYVISGSREKSASIAFEEETSCEDPGGEYCLDIHDGEYESFRSTPVRESTSELVSKSELFQDPLVSHRLTIPYKEIPPSRYCVGGSRDDSANARFLAKRPQSPVRDIPPGRFDVRAGIAEVTRRAEVHNAKYALRKSKEWMAKTITLDSITSPTSYTGDEPLTTFLKVLLDDVRLSLTVGESANDLSLTLATIWAITEFGMTGTGLVVTQSITVTNLGAVPKLKRSMSHNLTLLKATSFQRTSDISYIPRGSDVQFLHRALPWFYLCSAHAEGLPKSYATVRSYIDEITPDNGLKRSRIDYLPDAGCAHFEGMSSRRTVSVKNKAEEPEP